MNEKSKQIQWIELLFFFGIPAILLFAAIHLLIPLLERSLGIPPVLGWFVSSMLLVFIPMFVAVFLLMKRERARVGELDFKKRLRLVPLRGVNWVWTIVGFCGVGFFTWLFIWLGERVVPGFTPSPSFMQMEPLTSGTYWILLLWLPAFVFNILSEELYWRGYLFPRMLEKFGSYTWLIHGTGWAIFHLSFGWTPLITLIPIVYLQSWIVQKTGNTWSGVFIHGMTNGIGFLTVAFGLVN